MSLTDAPAPEVVGPDLPHWYKDAVIYELHVRAFCDSDGDGNGDFRGLVSRLDYLQELGVTALWLLPFYPSPLKDDGYDIADYRRVHPLYGDLRDFRTFLREAHRRGLRVITELVLAHTSDQHPWFQRARRSPPGSTDRDYYVWSETPDRFADARVIFSDFETSNWTWDPVAHAYFWQPPDQRNAGAHGRRADRHLRRADTGVVRRPSGRARALGRLALSAGRLRAGVSRRGLSRGRTRP